MNVYNESRTADWPGISDTARNLDTRNLDNEIMVAKSAAKKKKKQAKYHFNESSVINSTLFAHNSSTV
jgi:hypothetical protein